MRILLTGGGTGGHIFPLIAVARQLKKIASQKNLEMELYFAGAIEFYKEIFEKEGIKTKSILAGKLRRYFSWRFIPDFFLQIIGFFQALFYVWLWMPDAVFAKGGYGSFNVVMVCWLYHIPVLIHESDSIPGLANKILGKIAKRIAVSFDFTLSYFNKKKTALAGNPVREELLAGSATEAKKFFNIVSARPIIFIIGGSHGAQRINQIALEIIAELLKNYEIIWQVGKNNFDFIKKDLVAKNISPETCRLFPFLEEEQLKNAFYAADLVVSRAGANTIFEIAAIAKPSILIPLPTAASDHQIKNAFEYAKTGACLVIEQDNLLPHLFLEEIGRIIKNEEIKKKMSEAAKNFSKPAAAQKIAAELLNLGI